VVRESNSRSRIARQPPAPRRSRRRNARRDEILRAAARTFRRRGFADTGMRDIALEADLSPANLYHYFHGKDEILYYCQDRALDRMLEAVAHARKADPTGPGRLRLVLTAHLTTMLDEVEGATAHLQIDSLPEALRDRIVRKRDRYERAIRRILTDGVRRGECVAPDPALAVRAMLGALNWTVTWFDPRGPKSADDVAAAVSDFLVRGVAARPGAAPRALRLMRPL
jgi:AcrR family transcriptional regulator